MLDIVTRDMMVEKVMLMPKVRGTMKLANDHSLSDFHQHGRVISGVNLSVCVRVLEVTGGVHKITILSQFEPQKSGQNDLECSKSQPCDVKGTIYSLTSCRTVTRNWPGDHF